MRIEDEYIVMLGHALNIHREVENQKGDTTTISDIGKKICSELANTFKKDEKKEIDEKKDNENNGDIEDESSSSTDASKKEEEREEKTEEETKTDNDNVEGINESDISVDDEDEEYYEEDDFSDNFDDDPYMESDEEPSGESYEEEEPSIPAEEETTHDESPVDERRAVKEMLKAQLVNNEFPPEVPMNEISYTVAGYRIIKEDGSRESYPLYIYVYPISEYKNTSCLYCITCGKERIIDLRQDPAEPKKYKIRGMEINVSYSDGNIQCSMAGDTGYELSDNGTQRHQPGYRHAVLSDPTTNVYIHLWPLSYKTKDGAGKTPIVYVAYSPKNIVTGTDANEPVISVPGGEKYIVGGAWRKNEKGSYNFLAAIAPASTQ